MSTDETVEKMKEELKQIQKDYGKICYELGISHGEIKGAEEQLSRKTQTFEELVKKQTVLITRGNQLTKKIDVLSTKSKEVDDSSPSIETQENKELLNEAV